MHQINILIHVIAGIIALCVGIISYSSQKGGRRHRLAGRVFMVCMGGVLATAAVGVLFFRDRPFLALLTVQSLYMAVSGYRATRYKQEGPGRIDLLIAFGLIGAGVAFVWNLHQSNIVWSPAVIYYTLSVLVLAGTYDMLRGTGVFAWSHAWLPEHLLKMTMAYGALLSAGLGALVPDLGPYTQIVPAGLATILLIGVTWRYRATFSATTLAPVPENTP